MINSHVLKNGLKRTCLKLPFLSNVVCPRGFFSQFTSPRFSVLMILAFIRQVDTEWHSHRTKPNAF